MATLVILDLALFCVILFLFNYVIRDKTVGVKTVDMIYKALENFIFLSIAGVFLFQQIDDYKSHRRHMLRLQTGMRTSVYFLTQFLADMTLYFTLNIPSILMVAIGYRHYELNYIDQSYLVFAEILTKIAFGFALMPLIYLIGFWQRTNSENIYKSLGQIMYVIGHFINMIFLSIINYLSKRQGGQGKICSMNDSIFMIVFMSNPFTFSFFGPVLDYFVCERLSSEAHTITLVYSLFFIFLLGPGLLTLVIYLDEKSFKEIFKGSEIPPSSEGDDHGLIVEMMAPDGTSEKDHIG